MIAASTGLAITAANLVWYILRRLGLWTVEQGSRGPHGHACCRIAGGCRAHVHAGRRSSHSPSPSSPTRLYDAETYDDVLALIAHAGDAVGPRPRRRKGRGTADGA